MNLSMSTPEWVAFVGVIIVVLLLSFPAYLSVRNWLRQRHERRNRALRAMRVFGERPHTLDDPHKRKEAR